MKCPEIPPNCPYFRQDALTGRTYFKARCRFEDNSNFGLIGPIIASVAEKYWRVYKKTINRRDPELIGEVNRATKNIREWSKWGFSKRKDRSDHAK
jgi:hypothetical protein